MSSSGHLLLTCEAPKEGVSNTLIGSNHIFSHPTIGFGKYSIVPQNDSDAN